MRNFNLHEMVHRLAWGGLRVMCFGLLLILSLPFWLLWIGLVSMLIIFRPFIAYPLVFGLLGAIFAAILFAYHHLWKDAFEAGLAALFAWGLLVLYLALVGHLDDNPSWRHAPPPWHWFD